jgi:hypothetical protein
MLDVGMTFYLKGGAGTNEAHLRADGMGYRLECKADHLFTADELLDFANEITLFVTRQEEKE